MFQCHQFEKRRRYLSPLFFCSTATVRRASREVDRAAGEETGTQKQPWLVGSNYNPASAINQLEMWQADSFDPKRIDLELGWAESLGMNTMRVYLHDLLWQQDAEGFKQRLDTFLTIAAKHKIKPIFVLFDSVWDPDPKLGKQRAPRPGVHNSGWVQSPSRKALQDPAEYPRLEAYVKGVVGAFATDERVLAWDIWNEPDNDKSTAAMANWNRRTKSNSCWRYCRRPLHGRVRLGRSNR